MGGIRVVVVDDHRMVADGLATVLQADPRITVLGCAATATAALGQIELHRPDVVVADLRMPGHDGVDLARSVLGMPGAMRVVLISAAFTPAALQAAMEAGVMAFASKLAPADELVQVVVAAAEGTPYMSSDVVPLLTEVLPSAAGTPKLTPREREVVQGLADGLSVDELAARLFLSPHTVRNHIRTAMAALGVHRRLDAVVVAARAGLICLPE